MSSYAVTAAYTAAPWTGCAAAAVAAGTTLSGLVFVAVSINLNRILELPSLPVRAWQTLSMLMTPPTVGFFLLVPRESRTVLACELLVSGLTLAGGRLVLHHQAVRSEKDAPLPLVGHFAGFLTALVPALSAYASVAVAGATLLAKRWGWVVLVGAKRPAGDLLRAGQRVGPAREDPPNELTSQARLECITHTHLAEHECSVGRIGLRRGDDSAGRARPGVPGLEAHRRRRRRGDRP
jgi:hypothetical protein